MTYIIPVVMLLLLLPIWTFKVAAGFLGMVQMMADFESRQRRVNPVSSK
ncbi:hypothetical protein [Desmospora profundinema]|uniref:Uncharacterized protein n=1 Tax=Desmospora profundinema TaxID=1571184 RepID=A0ABU1IHT5_9BACL|nr:hypothetical protein [Desmospora profundinema]MDR6224107.1 hypothetical protein [Desmospora profundinema]